MPGKNKFFFIILLIASLLLISGCSECKKSTDCEAKSCFTTKCADKKCEYNIKDNCCGNERCEDGTVGKDFGENKGNCQKDCGACSGDAGKYLKTVYDNVSKDCATALDESNVIEDSMADTIDLNQLKLAAVYTYDNPFNIDKSLFNAEIKLDNKEDIISNVKITQIKVLETVGRGGGGTSIFGEADIDKILWDTDSVAEKDIRLTVPIEGTETEKELTVEVYYEFTKEYRGQDIVTTGSYKKELSSSLIFVDPEITGRCPSSCDDNNKCTEDVCGEQTDYFCQNRIRQGIVCCGDNKCDGTENECTCKKDCGKCERNYGTFMTFACSEDDCKSKLKDKEVMQPKTLIEQPNLNNFQFEVKTKFDEPFDVRTSKMTLDIELTTKEEAVSSIKCTKYQVLVDDVLLGEEIVTNTFGSRGSKANLDITLDFSMKNVEEEMSPVLKGSCEYDRTSGEQTDHLITSFSQSLGSIVFVKTEI
ncbi:MAG: hypothetical protein QF506_02760 [Candidatus Woesearchaeota archaeon]|jgi:hypothetical protein|nr:hypothetical protein [Candidatus Woesearchaeota archaeon]